VREKYCWLKASEQAADHTFQPKAARDSEGMVAPHMCRAV
jgi:hypothetical protein